MEAEAEVVAAVTTGTMEMVTMATEAAEIAQTER
jgi:hypothetical protein